MEELRENEQFFFTQRTQNWLVGVLSNLTNVAILSCPSLSLRPELQNREDIMFLDIDTRFPKVTFFDITNPLYLGKFDAVIFDPPFFNVKLSQMVKAVSLLLNHDYSKKLLITYLARRQNSFITAFARFNLHPIGEAEYETLVKGEKNRILFYANFDV